jgi:hypothetical protein
MNPIDSLRAEFKLPLTQICEACGASYYTLSSIKSGRRNLVDGSVYGDLGWDGSKWHYVQRIEKWLPLGDLISRANAKD